MITTTKTHLTEVQSARKAELEKIITTHIASFKLCGEALGEIKRDELYLEEHDTFEDYCRDKWGISARRGYQQIKAAETAKSCEQVVRIPNEATAREISKLPKTKDRIAAAKILAKAKIINSSTAARAVEHVQSRGGLAAQMRDATEIIDVEPSSPDVILDAETRAAVIRIIDEWYVPRRNRLNEYPPLVPDKLIPQIKALFE